MSYVFPLRNVPRPGSRVFMADWKAQGPGLTLAITQDCPPQVSGPASIWKTFDRPGAEGQGLVDPQPNQYLASSGSSLFFNFPGAGPGAPIITSQTFDRNKAISVEAVMEATFPDGAGCTGPMIYRGEGSYVGLYLIPSGAFCQVAVFTPDFSSAILPFAFPQGEVHILRVDYYQGTGLCFLDEQLIDVRNYADLNMITDPHAGMFLGGKGNIGRFDVCVG